MTVKEKSIIVSLIISLTYIGIGSIKLLSIITGDGMAFSELGETFDEVILPSYIFGFGLGYGGGTIFAIFGQLIVFGIVFGIAYFLFLMIFNIIERNSKKK